MRLLTRYVLWELLKVFLVALTGLTLIMLVYGLLKQANDQGLGPAQVVRVIPFVLPDMLRFTIPATILFAACSVYGRMSGSNEVVAIKSLGISPMVVLWPCFIFATFLSLMTVWLNDVAVTWGQAGVQRVVIESVEEIMYSMLRTQRSYSAPHNVSILVSSVEGRRLMQPIFNFPANGDQQPVTLSAQEAELRANDETLKIICHHCTIETENGFSGVTDLVEREILLTEASRSGDGSRIPTRVPLSLIPVEKKRVQHDLNEFQRGRAMQVGMPMVTGDFETLDAQNWKNDAQALTDFHNHLHRLATEPPRRWSAGFSCLCFALIGAPMAIWRQKADFLTSFFLCFCPILFVYYPLLVFGVEQAKSGALDPYIVWLGNLILAGWGLWLLRRKVLRY
ncbi:MAG TPA: LptF/LptG family permease [Pirellulales bacterium]|nr:LptF/LptG family permease [Pirellulales bacterium]